MRNKAVIGLGFGDEGKGRVVDALCAEGSVSLVVRYCGGHQAAHHVLAEGIDHVFSNFGSGTLRGVPTYWSQYCTVDPLGLRREYDLLKKKGVSPTIYIDERCPVTLILDKIANVADHENLDHGTCGVGFGMTLKRHEEHYSLCFGDLGFPSVVKAKYELIQKYYDRQGVADLFKEAGEDQVQHMLQVAELECIKPTLGVPSDFQFQELLFEGSQGLLLDKDIGFFPHVTRANTGTKNLLEIDPSGVPYVYAVTRAYQTRHGIGPMTNEHIPNNIKDNPFEEQDEEGMQGRFRVSLLDLDLLEYAIRSDPYIRDTPSVSLCITCMDLVQDEFRLTHKGKIFGFSNEDDFVTKIVGTLGIDHVMISRNPMGDLERK